jgi:serine/threonine protein kinase
VKNDNNNEQSVNNNNGKIIYEYYELMEKADMDWEKEICERRKNNNYYTKKELLNIIFQLVTALSSLQKNHITHRDIKPQNVLIIKGKYKLCDFGEMRELEKDGLIIQRVRGSELYMSTILFNALHNNLALVKHNTYKSDVFSLGMCLFYAASLSYAGVDSIRELNDMNEIKNILFNHLGTGYSEKLISLILLMLEVDENKRPNFIQLEKMVKLYFGKF